MTTHDKLRELAQAATPGPWTACGPSHGGPLPKHLDEIAVDREGDDDDGVSVARCPQGMAGIKETDADMAYIAAANPSTVLRLLDEIAALKAELETERMRLAACGVVAMSNTPDSAKRSRDMLPEYRSASCEDVMRAVDREMALRDERDALKAENERLKVDAGRVTREMAHAAASEWDAWSKDNQGSYECFEACIRAALKEQGNG